MDFTKINLLDNNVLVITNEDGSTTCIAEEIANEEAQLIFTAFRSQYPIGKTVDVDLATIIQNKINEIGLACKGAIVGGFPSTAFQGVSKIYSSDSDSQQNILGNAVGAMSKNTAMPGCANDKFYYHAMGEIDFSEWTAQQCLDLSRDWKFFKETTLFREKALINYVLTLTNAITVQNITWTTVMPI